MSTIHVITVTFFTFFLRFFKIKNVTFLTFFCSASHVSNYEYGHYSSFGFLRLTLTVVFDQNVYVRMLNICLKNCFNCSKFMPHPIGIRFQTRPRCPTWL